jgi:hypothetical protein
MSSSKVPIVTLSLLIVILSLSKDYITSWFDRACPEPAEGLTMTKPANFDFLRFCQK